jgi:hypothetical protein
VAPVRELMIVQTAGQFRLLQMCSDMFVGHFLHPSLEKIAFLRARISTAIHHFGTFDTDLVLRPGPVSSSGHLAAPRAKGTALSLNINSVMETGHRVKF